MINTYAILVLIGAIIEVLFRGAVRCAVILIPIYLIAGLLSGKNLLRKE